MVELGLGKNHTYYEDDENLLSSLKGSPQLIIDNYKNTKINTVTTDFGL